MSHLGMIAALVGLVGLSSGSVRELPSMPAPRRSFGSPSRSFGSPHKKDDKNRRRKEIAKASKRRNRGR